MPEELEGVDWETCLRFFAIGISVFEVRRCLLFDIVFVSPKRVQAIMDRYYNLPAQYLLFRWTTALPFVLKH